MSDRTASPVLSSVVWLRLVAVVGIAATIFGRALAPASRGIASDGTVRALEIVGGAASQLALILGAITLVGTGLAVLRSDAPLLVRVVTTATSGLVLGLSLPSSIDQPSAALSVFLALSASATALLASSIAIGSARSRALGIAIFLLTLGAMTHECAWVLAVRAGDAADVKAALLARTIALGALVLEGLGAGLALVWLATRPRAWITLLTSLATAASMALAVTAQRADGATHLGAMVAGRAGWLLGTSPPADVPMAARTFVPALRLTLACAALVVPGKDRSLGVLFALAMLAGVDLDLAVCALFAATASLASTLPTHDDDAATISPR